MWTVVDANGEYVRSANGKDPMIIRSQEINSHPSMQSAFKVNLDRKLARARSLRADLIAGTTPEGEAENYITRRY